MQKTQLTQTSFNWFEWQSGEDDVRSLGPQLAARMLWDVFLIHEFEHAVLNLKNDDCVWGPIHSSVGQEAIAAATIPALRKTDKVLATHRAHHQFLAKALHFVLAESWNPASDDLPDAGSEVVRRTMAEIMGLAMGYCGGRGGSNPQRGRALHD